MAKRLRAFIFKIKLCVAASNSLQSILHARHQQLCALCRLLMTLTMGVSGGIAKIKPALLISEAGAQVYQLAQPQSKVDSQWLTALPSAQLEMQLESPATPTVPSWQPATAALHSDETPAPVSS